MNKKVLIGFFVIILNIFIFYLIIDYIEFRKFRNEDDIKEIGTTRDEIEEYFQVTIPNKKKLVEENLVFVSENFKKLEENFEKIEEFQKIFSKMEEKINKVEENKDLLNSKQYSELFDFKEKLKNLNEIFQREKIFFSGESNLISLLEFEDEFIKIIKNKNAKDIYIMTKKGVIGPIGEGKNPEVFSFSELEENEYFIKANFLAGSIYLITNKSRVVLFNKNFSFVNASGQDSWEKMKHFEVYNSSLYILGEDNQIYRHQWITRGIMGGKTYINEEDLEGLGNIIGMSIDGGFFMVKDDLSVVKVFTDPYLINSIGYNNIPSTFKLNTGEKFEIKAGVNLEFVYMLLGDRIFIFKPDRQNYRTMTTLNYIGQIEGYTERIIDFYVEKDKELIVLNKKGLYRLKFDINEGKINLIY